MELFNVLDAVTSQSSICDSIPDVVFNITSIVIFAIQIVVPVLLIIWGMIDFTKAVVGQDDSKMKEAQKVFIKRLIAAAIVFLTVTIVKLLLNLVVDLTRDDSEGTMNIDENTWSTCINKFINGADATSNAGQ